MTHDEFDEVLDAALASYCLVEPRAGLPGRVMARVDADGRAGGALSRGWWWLLTAVACSALLAIVVWRGRAKPDATVILRPPMETAIPVRPDPVPQVEVLQPARRVPRREIPPAPIPLTPEERALMAFVQAAPEQALQWAQSDKPLEIEAIQIRPIEIDGLEIGEIQ
jgi:hypothetical protein